MFYRIPIAERIIELRKGASSNQSIVVDNVPYTVKCNEGEKLDLEEIKKKPTIILSSSLIIEADSLEELISSFETGPYLKARYINSKKLPIIEIDCPRIGKNNRGGIICGKEISMIATKSGTFGFCILCSKNLSPNCDILEKIKEIDKNKNHPRRRIEIRGKEYDIVKIETH